MRIIVEKSKFENELRLFQGIFERKPSKEILQNVKITATEPNIVELVGTDLEVGLTSSFLADVQGKGSFTIKGKDLFDLISKMNEGKIIIEEDNDLQVVVANEKRTSKYKMKALPVSDYPPLPQADFKEAINLPFAAISKMINYSYFLISPDLKFNLSGALLSISGGKIEMAATDAHRLSYSIVNTVIEVDSVFETIISKKSMMELIKLANDGELQFVSDANNLFFKAGNRILCCRVIDQKFPNFRQAIPEKFESSLVVDRELLLQTMKRIMVFKTNDYRVEFKISADKMIVYKSSYEKGEGHDEVEIELQGRPITVGFNGNFILDFLNHVESEKIKIEYNDGESAFQLRPSGPQEVAFYYILMPLNA